MTHRPFTILSYAFFTLLFVFAPILLIGAVDLTQHKILIVLVILVAEIAFPCAIHCGIRTLEAYIEVDPEDRI